MVLNVLCYFFETRCIIAFFAFGMYYRSFLYVFTTHVTVCVYHTEIIGYLLTYK